MTALNSGPSCKLFKNLCRLRNPSRPTSQAIVEIAVKIGLHLVDPDREVSPAGRATSDATQLLHCQDAICGRQTAWVEPLKCSVEEIVFPQRDALKSIPVRAGDHLFGFGLRDLGQSPSERRHRHPKLLPLLQAVQSRSVGLVQGDANCGSNRRDRTDALKPIGGVRARPIHARLKHSSAHARAKDKGQGAPHYRDRSAHGRNAPTIRGARA